MPVRPPITNDNLITKRVVKGVMALSRETGLSPATVSVHLRRGKTPAQVRELAQSRQTWENKKRTSERLGVPVRMPEPPTGAVATPPAPPAQTGYKPGRTVPKKDVSTSGPPASTPVHKLSNPKRVGMTDGAAPSKPALPKVTVDPEFDQHSGEYTYEDAVADHQQAEKIDQARLRRAIALADKQELENAQKIAELVPIAQIRVWGTRFLVQARDLMLKGPSEMQDQLANETVPGKCNQIVRDWVDRVLGELRNLESLWTVNAVTGADAEERVA